MKQARTIRASIEAMISDLEGRAVPRETNTLDLAASRRIVATMPSSHGTQGFSYTDNVMSNAIVGTRKLDTLNTLPLYMGFELEHAYSNDDPSCTGYEYLEVERNKHASNRRFMLKTDGSLHNYIALEMATRISTITPLKTLVAEFINKLSDCTVYNPTRDLAFYNVRRDNASDTDEDVRQYGMHVHISWDCISRATLGNAASYYQGSGDRLWRMAYVLGGLFPLLNRLNRNIGGRDKTRWCVGPKSNSLGRIAENVGQRGAINYNTHHKTVEFRFGRGIMDADHACTYIEHCNMLFRFAEHIVAHDLEHLCLLKSNGTNNNWRSDNKNEAFMTWLNGNDKLLVYTPDLHKKQRKLINMMYYDFVMSQQHALDYLPKVVDGYYQTKGRHHMKAVKSVEVEDTQQYEAEATE